MPSVTRVAVTIDGIAKQVMRIKERSDGTLYLNCQVGRNFEDGEVHRAIKEDHYTIHPPERGRGVTLKRTTQLAGEKKIEQTAYVPIRNDGAMAAAMYAKFSQDLSLPEYDLNPKSADRVVSLGEIAPARQSMVFALAVCSLGLPARLLRLPELDFAVIPFKQFQLAFSHAAISLPSSPFGRYAHILTSSPRVDGGEYVQLEPLRRLLSPAEVRGMIKLLLASVVRRQLEYLAEHAAEGSEFQTWLRGQAERQLFLPVPSDVIEVIG